MKNTNFQNLRELLKAIYQKLLELLLLKNTV